MTDANHSGRKQRWQTVKKVLLLLITFLIGYSFHGCSSRSDSYVRNASWMPEGASRGAYAHGPTFILGPPAFYHEYDISEEDFKKHFSKRERRFEEITGSVSVPRYLLQHVRRDEFELSEAYLDGLEGEERLRVEEEQFLKMENLNETLLYATVESGVFYEHSVEDRRLVIAYDRKKGRAFYYSQTR